MKKKLIIGVYSWKNIITNKRYIGVSIDIESRWKQHIKNVKKGFSGKFYNAIRKYGEIIFEKEILETFEVYNKKILKEREDYYIDLYDSLNNGYNTEKGYNTIIGNINYEDIVEKIREKAKKRKWIHNNDIQKSCYPNELEKYLNEGWILGRIPFSDKHIKNLSDSHLGYFHTDITKEKLSKLWKGKKHTTETKEKMSKKLKGRYSIKWYHDTYGIEEGNIKYKIHHDKLNDQVRGCKCINNGIINKMIKKNDNINKYLNEGWILGRVKKQKEK